MCLFLQDLVQSCRRVCLLLARTILLLHIISVRPSKQPLMVRTFLKVYMELGSYFLFLQEQIKDIIIIRTYYKAVCGGGGGQ